MTKLILVRHGETVWNSGRRYQGQQDSALTAVGLRQAEQTAEFLSKQRIDAVFSSDLPRAVLTASVIAKPHGLAPRLDSRLREMSFGVWEGLSREEIAQSYAQLLETRSRDPLNTRIPGGELPGEAAGRLRAFLDEQAPLHQDQTVVLVSHGGALRFTLASLLLIPLERSYCLRLDNAGISELYFTPGDQKCPWQVTCLNSTAHLL